LKTITQIFKEDVEDFNEEMESLRKENKELYDKVNNLEHEIE
jgi:cell division protein FtsB